MVSERSGRRFVSLDILTFISLLTLSAACNSRQEIKFIKPVSEVKTSIESMYDSLDAYFEKYEIKPALIFNNPGGNVTEIPISTHKIKWINSEEETKIVIDKDLISLKGKLSLNNVWENQDSVDFANNWEEIKLYDYKGGELLAIRMVFDPCTGLGCSVAYYLVYDFQTKTRNFFGTFRTDNKLALYDFMNDNKLDYISKTFRGDAHGSTPMEFIYELYSMEDNGRFMQQKNSSGQPYQIRHTTFPNDSTKSALFEQRWFSVIK